MTAHQATVDGLEDSDVAADLDLAAAALSRVGERIDDLVRRAEGIDDLLPILERLRSVETAAIAIEARLHSETLRWAQVQYSRVGESLLAVKVARLESVRRLERPERRGRRGYGPEHYAEVAQRFEEAGASGRSGYKAVAEWLGTAKKAANHIHRARVLGLLERKHS